MTRKEINEIKSQFNIEDCVYPKIMWAAMLMVKKIK